MTTVVDLDELPWYEAQVKSFSIINKWGFLTVPGIEKDVFFHQNAGKKSGMRPRNFVRGTVIRVSVHYGPRGPHAHQLAPKEKP